MSSVDFDGSDLPAPICRYCGFAIEEPEQDCIALDDGVYAP
jgi:hypothetical protein